MRRRIGVLLGVLTSVAVTIATGLFVYVVASRQQVNAFWDQTPGALMLYGRLPSPEYREAYRTAAASARAAGFRFTDPELVQTNDLFNLWYLRWRRSAVIAVSSEGERLLVDRLWMSQFADEDLECIFAHELGHVIDFQRQSDDHPVMKRLECLDTQQRADSIGRYLCGGDRYDRILRRYVKKRPVVRMPCAVSDPVTR